MYHIYVYIPETHLEAVKTAMFDVGAGRIGNYDCCCWQTKGEGQYRALAGSHPYQGELNQIEKQPEYKVELVCDDYCLNAVIKAMKAAHPYEEPAYGFWQINA